MKKYLCAVFAAVILAGFAMSSFADASNEAKTQASQSGPFRICFWPGVWYWPKGINIYGLSLGLPVTYNGTDTVAGLDAAIGASMSDNVDGARLSILMNDGKDSTGFEASIVNLSNNFGGVSLGLLNQASKNSDFVQIGLVNQSTDSKGIQIGLICMMDNGFLPIFPIINFGFSEKKAEK